MRWSRGCGGTIPARFQLHVKCWRRHLAQRVLLGFLGTYARDCTRAATLALRFYERIRKVQRYAKGYLAVVFERRRCLERVWAEAEPLVIADERRAALARAERRRRKYDAQVRLSPAARARGAPGTELLMYRSAA